MNAVSQLDVITRAITLGVVVWFVADELFTTPPIGAIAAGVTSGAAFLGLIAWLRRRHRQE